MPNRIDELAQLKASIDALEAQRPSLGDTIVEPALAALREKLAALEGQAQPEQQRKLATILFMDIAGHTQIVRDLDPEANMALIDAALARLAGPVGEYGGHIARYQGDGFKAVFGLPVAHEDDPENAVRAALAIQDVARHIAAEWLADYGIDTCRVRVGLDTGLVVAGGLTEGDDTIKGMPVNLAARLESAAQPGAILISHNSYRHIRGVFDVQPQEPITVKGVDEPVRTYVVQRAKPRAFRMPTRGVEGIETRMIGRDAELLALQNAFLDVVDAPAVRFVTIVGEAGVGKSRLLYEFENWIELQPVYVYYFKGRSTPSLQRQSFGLWRNLLSYRFDIRDSDEAGIAVAKFRAGLSDVLTSDQADVLGQWLGFDFSISPAVARLISASDLEVQGRGHLLRFFRALAEKQPIAFLLEDIHWADDASLTLVQELFRYLTVASQRARLFSFGLARPAFFERRPHWGEGLSGFSRMSLKPLSPRAGRALVDEILQRVERIPDDLRDVIVESTEGNPFYLEETIKMLIDEGVILRGEERWQITRERLITVHIPPTLTGLLQARLDALPPAERKLLQQAAVVGRLFWDTTVAAISDAERTVISPSLKTIRERELIYLREHSAFSGSEEYIFKHALLRDVTYETVLLKMRRAYHARVAQWLESNAGSRLNEYLGQIAEHYSLAGEVDRAADFWERAGDYIFQSGAVTGALEAYERAAELTTQSKAGLRNPGLIFKLGKTLLRSGHLDKAKEHFQRVCEQARSQGDTELQVATLEYLVYCADRHGDYLTIDRLLEEALPLAQEIGGSILAQHMVNSGSAHWRRQEWSSAFSELEQGLALARQAGDLRIMIDSLNLIGSLATERRDFDTAERALLDCRRLAAELGDRYKESAVVINLGNLYYEQGDFPMARKYYEFAFEASRELGALPAEYLGLINLAFTDVAMGDLDAARQHTRQALSGGRVLNLKPILTYGVLIFGKIAAADDDLNRALALFGLVQSDPSTGFDARHDLEIAIAALNRPADDIAAGLAAGAALDLDAVVLDILEGNR